MRQLIGATTSELRPSGMGTLRRQGAPDHPEMALGMTYLQAIERAGGVTLHQHVDGHRQSERGCTVTHEVEVLEGTRLAGLIGPGTHAVNSFHHQAVRRLGSGLTVAARAGDGTVEAIERAAGFVVGV